MRRTTRPLRIEPLEDRLTPALALDPSFGVQGRTFLTAGPVPQYGQFQDAVVRPDGKVWALGSVGGNTILARFNANGQLDATFDGDGVEPILAWSNAFSSFTLSRIALQADGRVVLAGVANRPLSPATYPSFYNTSPELLAMRLNADGSYDPTFGDGGRVVVDLGATPTQYSAANALAVRVLSDGRIAVAGNEFIPILPAYASAAPTAALTIPPPATVPNYFGVRLTADGKADATYDGDGVAILPLDNTAGYYGYSAGSADILADGRAVFAVTRSTPYSNPQPATLELFAGVYRLAADGSRDATFDGDGYAEARVATAAVPAGGSGSLVANQFVLRAQPDGRVVVAVAATNSSYDSTQSQTQNLIVTRFTTAGQQDQAFGSNGLLVAADLTTAGSGVYKSLGDLAALPDGRVAVLVNTSTSDQTTTTFSSTLKVYTAAGQPDATAGANGEVTVPAGPARGESLQPSRLVTAGGKLLLGGTTDASGLLGSRIGLIELADNPPAVPPTANNQNPVGRFVAVNGPRSLNLDPGFGDGGSPVFLSTTLGPISGSVTATVADGSGRYLVLGVLSSTPVLARFNADGTLDPSFDGDGVRPFPPAAETEYVSAAAVAVQPDGKILLAGSRTTYPPGGPSEARPFLRRLNADGSDDATFGTGGVVTFAATTPASSYESVLKVGTLAGGKVVLVSTVTDYTNSPTVLTAVVRRLNTDGTPDTTFDGDGTAAVGLAADRFQQAGGAAILADGSVLIAGSRQTTATPATATVSVLRITAAGAVDSAFGAGGYADATLLAAAGSSDYASVTPPLLAVQPDGSIVVGAQANLTQTTSADGGTTYQSTTTTRFVLVRFTPAGAADAGFGTGGRVVLDATTTGGAPPYYSYASLVALPDGRLSLLSTANQYGTPTPVPLAAAASPSLVPATPTRTTVFVRRFTAAGGADTSFGTLGTYAFTLPAAGPATLTPGQQLVDAAGKVVLAGSSPSGVGLARLAKNPVSLPSTLPTVYVSGGGGAVEAFQRAADGALVSAGTYTPFDGYAGAVRVATADVNGDGFTDTVFSTNDRGSKVRVLLGGDPMNPAATAPAPIDLDVFEAGFDGGVNLAVGDVDGDGKAELAVTPNAGGSARVVVFSLVNGQLVTRANFFGIDDPDFRGGGTAAFGDLDGDGKMELIVAAGLGGGPRVAVYAGKSLFSVAAGLPPAKLVNDFFAFPGEDATRLRNGATVSAGDVTGDGAADLVFGGGPGGGARVYALDGKAFVAGQTVPVANFFVGGDATSRAGVRFVLKDLDGDGKMELIANATGTVSRAYKGTNLVQPNAVEPAQFDAFDSTASSTPTGVYVG